MSQRYNLPTNNDIGIDWIRAHDAGAYVLQNAESFRDKLSQVGRIAFSPVPRGWIDDSLIDGQIAVDQIHKRLTLKSKRSVFESSHIHRFSLTHNSSSLNLSAWLTCFLNNSI